MRPRGISLYLDSNQSKEKDLPCAHSAVPHGSANAVGVCKSGGSEENGTPCPGGDNTGRDETRFDRTGSRVEFLSLSGGVRGVAILQIGES